VRQQLQVMLVMTVSLLIMAAGSARQRRLSCSVLVLALPWMALRQRQAPLMGPQLAMLLLVASSAASQEQQRQQRVPGVHQLRSRGWLRARGRSSSTCSAP
jgi:hypothetical protein